MTDTYPHMNKINDLAASLIQELKTREASIRAEIRYAGVLEQGEEADYWERRGYDREEAHSKAADSLEKHYSQNGFETPYDEELKTIAAALAILEKLKAE